MLDLSKFIISTYFSPPMTSLQYETQLLKILIDNPNLMQSTFTQFRRQYSSLKRKCNAPVSIRNQSQVLNAEKSVQNVLKLIKQGPTFIYNACNRYLYKSNVVSFTVENYSSEIIQDVNIDFRSFEGSRYICRTCNTKLIKNKVPC